MVSIDFRRWLILHLCQINYYILTQYSTDNSVTYLNSLLKIGLPDIMMSVSVLSTAYVSLALCHIELC